MKQAFLAFERRMTQLATAGACVMMAASSILAMFQILTRFVLEQPAEWTEILIRLSLIWMVFLGSPIAFRLGAMMSVDVLHRLATPFWRRAIDWIVFIAALALVLVIIHWGWDYALRSRVQSMAGLESISMIWGYIAMPIGGVFCIFALIGHMLDPKHEELETAT
ncbi:TRAP transporter small permease [Castellaniella sp. S9]|uniref:TRAP transporter small permease n=1 Tax=Castellaniella sp. S9 TaxID=2993652 RepID=UPI0022B37ADB|nr:TRAP transporter small permease [Castellaniella sp. S9]